MVSCRTNFLWNARTNMSSWTLLNKSWWTFRSTPLFSRFILTETKTFVIHARHTTARIFYCKFPIPYLRNIAKHGAHYKTHVPSPQGVHLQHTKNYQLRDPALRGEFFRLLCRLISYLTTGNSHVPYLSNYAENALNTVLIPLQTGIHAQGRWSTFDVYTYDRHMVWDEPVVPWDEPLYPEEMTVRVLLTRTVIRSLYLVNRSPSKRNFRGL